MELTSKKWIIFVSSPLLRFRIKMKRSFYFGDCFRQRFSLSLSPNLRSKISAQSFISYVWWLKVKLLKAKFYINIMTRYKKKTKQSDHCRVTVEKKQHWNLKYQIQDPIILDVYELNIVEVETGKILN